MSLSKQKIALLKAFYEKEVIPFEDLPKYGTDSRSSLVRALKIDRLIEPANRVEGELPYYTAFKISDEGKAVYEAYLQQLDHEKKEWAEFKLLERQTIANEEAAAEAKKARKIADRATIISIAAIIISALVGLYQIQEIRDFINSLFT